MDLTEIQEVDSSGNNHSCVTDTVTDERPHQRPASDKATPKTSWLPVSEEITPTDFLSTPSEHSGDSNDLEIIEICGKNSREFDLCAENILLQKSTKTSVTGMFRNPEQIPDNVLWPSILSALEEASDWDTLVSMCTEFRKIVPTLKPRIKSVYNEVDKIDKVAQKEIPHDGPQNLKAICTCGDGNCLCRALSRAYFNDESHHIELRVCIVIEGVLNMKHYISDECLERGASVVHHNANLPTVFTTFSEFYTPGQNITPDTVACIYGLEIHSIAKLGTYMGLWQLAQSASVLGIPVHTIYPVRGTSSIQNDFHRIFFPLEYPAENDQDPIVIMWTGMTQGSVPIHFVPLLPE